MYKFLLLIILALLLSCSQKQEESISIQNPWVRESPPNASAMAGYLTITNTTKQDRILTFAKSKQFNAVEIHRTIIKDGIAKMRRQDEITIPAGGSLELKPGDFHLMLMSPKQTFKMNDEIIVTLCIKLDNVIEEIDVVMPVKKP